MTFTDIVAEVARYAGRADDSTNVGKSVNAAIRRIEAEGNFGWMEQVATLNLPSVGTTDRIRLPYTDPPGIFKELRESITWVDPVSSERTALRPISEDAANYQFSTADSGEPEYYRVWKGMLYVYPPNRTQARALRLPYWKWTATLSGTANHDLFAQWQELVIARALVEYLRSNRDFKGAAVWLGDAGGTIPGTYTYELRRLKKATARLKLTNYLGVGSAGRGTSSGYPWWGR